jgi:hypothetical protein
MEPNIYDWIKMLRVASETDILWSKAGPQMLKTLGIKNAMPTPSMILARKRPRNISEADWRMALRRKLNGDTR